MMTAPLRWLAPLVLLFAAMPPATGTELSSAGNVYFDPDAIDAPLEAFNPAIAVPRITDYTPGSWGLDASRPIEPRFGFWRSQPLWTNQEKKEDDSVGRIPLSGGSFGIETERKFDADKSIPSSSQFFDSMIDRYSKKPFVGLSIEAPFNSEDR
jgi:hypothetical protein